MSKNGGRLISLVWDYLEKKREYAKKFTVLKTVMYLIYKTQFFVARYSFFLYLLRLAKKKKRTTLQLL